jgi:hypothetical protein
MSRIPSDKTIRTFQRQLGPVIKLLSYAIVMKTSDPLKILYSGAVSYAAIGMPDSTHVVDGGRGDCVDSSIGWLGLHGALILLTIQPY